MIEIAERLQAREHASPSERLELAFEARTKTRQRARLAGGEEVALLLPRGTVLRGGDLLRANDGRVVEVIARPESVLHVVCDTPHALARAAYHLGNRHVAVEVGEGYLRLARDHVLQQMLKGLGASVTELEAPFEPESGAYSGHSYGSHGHHRAEGSPGRIHEYRRIPSQERDEISE